MEKEHSSIVRHESLYSLSHHHHHGLVLALRLKRVETEKSRFSIDEMKAQVASFWEPGGQQHFREEEEILLPVYAMYGSLEQPEITEMLVEHVQIRALIHQILNTEESTAEEKVALMHGLGALLETHIRKEERIIFPMIEKALPEKVLIDLAPCFE